MTTTQTHTTADITAILTSPEAVSAIYQYNCYCAGWGPKQALAGLVAVAELL